MLVPTLLWLFAATASAQDGDPSPVTRTRIARPGGPTLTVRWHEGAAVLERATRRERGGIHSHTRWLVSAVGPMTSVLERSTVPGGGGPRVNARLEVRFHRGYRFDLDAFLRVSHRAGRVASDLIAQDPLPTLTVDPAQCPSREELERSEGGLDYILGGLVGRGCLVQAGGVAGSGDALARRRGPRGFAIAAYDPERRRVTLDVEVANCTNRTTLCEVRTVRSQMEPPSDWVPWLEAALGRRGLFAQGQMWRVAGLSGRDAIALHRALGSPSGPHYDPPRPAHPRSRPPFVLARLNEPPEITTGGYDTTRQLQLRLEVTRILERGDLPSEAPGVGETITVHPPEGIAALGEGLRGLDEGDPPAAVRRAFPRLTRRGGRYLVVVGHWLERQRRSVVAPASARTLRFIQRHVLRDPR
ncbi:MAG TPA: hypothetical protein RMH99_08375 [Sandaracinaceae bacterium LLY-WYZ-13_1]|nr:hypothetical protein [Sandaracinaceae bacterium LLY-WYZ-13_1]